MIFLRSCRRKAGYEWLYADLLVQESAERKNEFYACLRLQELSHLSYLRDRAGPHSSFYMAGGASQESQHNMRSIRVKAIVFRKYGIKITKSQRLLVRNRTYILLSLKPGLLRNLLCVCSCWAVLLGNLSTKRDRIINIWSGTARTVRQCCGRILDILVRIRGFVPLTNGSASRSCYFCPWSSRRKTKNIFFLEVLLLISHYFLKCTFTSFFKIKSHKEVTKQYGRNQCFSYYFCLMIEGS